MYIYSSVTLVVLPIVIKYISCESASEVPTDIEMKSTFKNMFKNLTSTAELINSNKTNQHMREDSHKYYRVFITPSRLTKLTKSLSIGFDPYFSKDYFEPFERRPRPVTLVAFRKNGLVQKHIIQTNNDDTPMSLDVAELQSPYNDVGHFWEEDPGEKLRGEMLTHSKILVVFILTLIFGLHKVNSSLHQRDILSGESDDENIIKQALYLVKLLKSDYVKSLRDNSELEVIVNEENTTCPENVTHTTTPMNIDYKPLDASPPTLSSVVLSQSTRNEFSSPLLRAATPPTFNYVPPSVVQTAGGNILQPNYKLPYRFQRRRMVPDYYYYDMAMPRYGSFRRMGDVNPMEVPPYIQSAYRRSGGAISGSNIDETFRNGNIASATVPTTSLLITNSSSSTSQDPNIPTTAQNRVTTKRRKGLLKGKMRQLPTLTEVYNSLPSSLRSTKTTTRPWSPKAVTGNQPYHAKKIKHSRIQPSTEKPTSEDFLLSQVASELINEMRKTKTEKQSEIRRNIIKNNVLRKRQNFSPMFKSTMKLYLKASSRIQIPFPENNAFCHLYPQNKLCGAGI